MASEHVGTQLIEDRGKRGSGRRFRSAEERAAILERFDRSGMTQRAFAAAEGVVYPTLLSWLAKRTRVAGSTAPAVRFRELTLAPARQPQAGTVEVCLPCGTTLRGSDPAQLATLVRLLRS